MAAPAQVDLRSVCRAGSVRAKGFTCVDIGRGIARRKGAESAA